MKALARIVAEADGRGGTKLTELYGEAPLLPRRTGPTGPGPAEVHLVGGAAGPLGGDDLRLNVHVGAEASLVVRTVAASVALPGAGRSHTAVTATVATGGRLDWLPEPIIAASGCDHVVAASVDLAAGARLHWREELICGRWREEPGDLRLSLRVRYAGTPIYANDLSIGPAAAGWAGAAVLDAMTAYGSAVFVDPRWTPESRPRSRSLGPGVALLALDAPAVVVAVLGSDAAAVRTMLTEVDPHR